MLGPYVRSAIWVSGCCFDCKGCMAGEMNSLPPVKAAVDELVEIFSGAKSCEGISISGGEPFLQAEALSDLIEGIRGRRDYGVVAYTGFTLEELQGMKEKETGRLLGNIDILIDGRYEAGLDDGKPFRGSSNQRIILLTDRYRHIYDEYYLGHGRRNIEIMVEKERVFMVGVPSGRGLRTWRDLKKRAGGNVERI